MSLLQEKIRNIAIIAHVDHGKTTLVDQLFRQSGLYRDNQEVDERLMDSMDLEKERGITITSKNGAFEHKGFHINIIDTPGHADFGGQVERVLKMADGALLLVDAQEGPMPQTYFVVKKALALNIPIVVVINKIDKPAARPDWVLDQVFDLFVSLDAPDEILDFPVMYASAKNGFSKKELEDSDDQGMQPLYDSIINDIPAPKGDPEAPLQLLISSLSYDSFLGRLAVGKVTNGGLKVNQEVLVSDENGEGKKARITKIYRFKSNAYEETKEAVTGECVAVAGIADITVGITLTDPENPQPLPGIQIDPPTISMTFLANDSPFAGKEGEFVTARHLEERLNRETLGDVALQVQKVEGGGYKVSGRGELHVSILIEKMRREGYEFQVTRPKVIVKEIDGQTMEPFEDLSLEMPEDHMGKVIEALGERKAILQNMEQENGTSKIAYRIPTRGLLGFKSEFLTLTKGMGVMNYTFAEFAPYAGDIKNRKNGVLIVKDPCQTVAYALNNLQERGRLFMGPGVDVYAGQILGENAREDDMIVNAGKGKKLTNMRASGSDDNVVLTPPLIMSLEQCLTFINDDELLEVTPENIRLRKAS